MKRKIGVTFQIIGNTSEEFGWNKTNLKSAQSELMESSPVFRFLLFDSV